MPARNGPRDMHDHSRDDHHHDGHQHGHRDHAGHTHGHGDGHSHAGHSHAPTTFGKAFAIGTALNIGFVVIEAVFGVLAGSTALLADAGHNLADVLGLLAAWGAAHLATRPPSQRFTWGLRGTGILAALGNAVLLFVGAGAIGWESVLRLMNPEPVAGGVVMAVAAAGIVINGATALMFASGRKDDINIKGAFLHMAVDALVSAGVLVSGLVVLMTGWDRIDAIVGLAIAAFIVWSTWDLFRESVTMSLAAVPRQIDTVEIRALLIRQPGVSALHDLHIWPVGTTDAALSAHLVMPGGHPGDPFLMRVTTELRGKGIGHVTIQIETDAATACPLAPDHVI